MDLQVLYSEIEEIRRIVQIIETLQQADHLLLVEHDKILVRGNGVPSLQENMRVLSKSFAEFIVEVREERIRRNAQEEAELKKKQDNQTRWKWQLIGFGLPLVGLFLSQVIVFWFKIAPVLENIKLPSN